MFQQEMVINYKGVNNPHIQDLNCQTVLGRVVAGSKHIKPVYFSRQLNTYSAYF